MRYFEVRFSGLSKETSEMLVALLNDEQYEGFEEQEDYLKAYIRADLLDAGLVQKLAAQFNLKYEVNEMADTNWNAVWESNFQPIIINDWAIRADFHQPLKDAAHEIIITPKMSFGTGHHATTFMMVQQMQQISFPGKAVLDFGSGTGVLAILAQKLGAAKITAIDNDPLCIENATENFRKNNTGGIDLLLADHIATKNKFDIILANITRNIILENFSALEKHLKKEGSILLSGLLATDEEIILQAATGHHFTLYKKLERESWICLWLKKNGNY
jgi:ribosomal protein L11 methyltransferase